MGLLNNSRTRQTLGGVIGNKSRMGGYQLADMASRAQKAQDSAANTYSKYDKKKSSETKTKPSALALGTLGVSALGTGAKIYQGLNSEPNFKDMDAAAQQEYLDTLSPEAQVAHQKKYGHQYKADDSMDTVIETASGEGSTPVDNATNEASMDKLAAKNNEALSVESSATIPDSAASGTDVSTEVADGITDLGQAKDIAENSGEVLGAVEGAADIAPELISNVSELGTAVETTTALVDTANTASSGFEFLSMFA